jgi:glyoxylase-like metal-dependent hydrolase (beta-lactamase superfamily II)
MKYLITSTGKKIFTILRGRSNAYLIICNQHAILVDTGKKSTYTLLKKNIQNALPANTTLDFLVLTHTHFDHCQAAQAIANDYDCKIFASVHAITYVENGYTPLPRGTNFFSSIIANAGQRIGKKKFGYSPFIINFPVNSDQMPVFNTDIQIIQTPGHSCDCISVIIDYEIAIVGDALFGIFQNSVFPPFADDNIRLIESWKKLLDTNCRLFLPGHGKPVSRERLITQFEKHKAKTGNSNK